MAPPTRRRPGRSWVPPRRSGRRAPTTWPRWRLRSCAPDAAQAAERLAAGAAWQTHTYDGQPVSLVFTTAMGGLVNRQAVTKAIARAAEVAGLDPGGLATHAGRRTVITALYADGGVDLADVARHVGHSDTATTAGYVRNLGTRPVDTARRAAQLLDPSITS